MSMEGFVNQGSHKYICIICINLSSNSNKSGSFSTDGISQSGTINNTIVQCTSTHLTSFAVLIDISGPSVSLETKFLHYVVKKICFVLINEM